MTLPVRKFAVSRPRGSSEELPVVFHGSPTKAALHKTVHDSKKAVAQLAFECGISPTYLYRACLEGESGCRFPIELAAPLMRATHDFRLLGVLAGECDRAVVAMPRVRALKAADAAVVNEVGARFNGVMATVLRFFAAPDAAIGAELVQDLREHVAAVTALARAVADFHQRELL